jgi:hypothetical protein
MKSDYYYMQKLNVSFEIFILIASLILNFILI